MLNRNNNVIVLEHEINVTGVIKIFSVYTEYYA